MRRSRYLAIAIIAAFTATSPRIALAQIPVLGDSGTHLLTPVTAWGSLGIGLSSGGLTAVVRATVAKNALLLTYRYSVTGDPLFHSGEVKDNALLVGARTLGRSKFISAAIGYGLANVREHHSDGTMTHHNASVLAYDVAWHSNFIVKGVGTSLSGNVGPGGAALFSVAVSAELGWFGW